MFFKTQLSTAFVLAAAALSWCDPQAFAGERHFSFVYEAVTLPKGALEFESWAIWKSGHDDKGNSANKFEFRHELEYGLTDKLQLAVYLADWEIVDEIDKNEASFQHCAVEAIYNLTNPTTDWIGSALYGEFKIGPEVVELEGKLILQKNFGPIIVAYNAVLEAEWEGEKGLGRLDENAGEFQQTFGVSYEVSPSFSFGGELLHEIGFDEWKTAGDSVVFIGPNASLRFEKGYVTVAPLIQCTGIQDEPEVLTRLIFGVHL